MAVGWCLTYTGGRSCAQLIENPTQIGKDGTKQNTKAAVVLCGLKQAYIKEQN